MQRRPLADGNVHAARVQRRNHHREKVANILSLDYPSDKMEVIVVSDGSYDRTGEIVRGFRERRITYLETGSRTGKAEALNLGLMHAKNEIVVFSDASILLEKGAVKSIVKRFESEDVGCVSGEDRIASVGGEGLYGKYELFLRRRESAVGSIVGASGCFYAERRSLIEPFMKGMAPDFLSVLRTVEKGYLAVSESRATGTMSSLKDVGKEFSRKVRTFNRGMTTLWHKRHLLNPMRYRLYAVKLLSHKLFRWMVPFFLVSMYLSSAALSYRWIYGAIFICQSAFYAVALMAYADKMNLTRHSWARIPLYFTTVNVALAVAWYKYLKGEREEIWEPTERT